MIRILHSVSNMDRAGIETMLMNYYRNIDRNEIQFDFLCNKNKIGAYDDEIKMMGGNVYYSPGFNPFKIVRYIKFLKKIKEENPDTLIIHAHNAALSAYTLFCAKKAGFDIRIAHSHSTKIPSSKKCRFFDLKWLYKKILRNFVSCESTYNIACGNDAGKFLFKNNNYDIVYNAINISDYYYNEETRIKIRKQLSLESDTVLIGHVGRFNVVKNHVFMLNLIKNLKNINEKKYKFIFIGDGELKDNIINQANKENISDSIIFIDNISNVCDFYNAMDIFVLPSKFEGIPVVGIEAQANGLTTIFSDKISKEAKITDLVSYISIDNLNSIDMWVNEIKNYNDKYCRAIDYNLLKKYDVKYNVDKLVEIYNNLIHRN